MKKSLILASLLSVGAASAQVIPTFTAGVGVINNQFGFEMGFTPSPDYVFGIGMIMDAQPAQPRNISTLTYNKYDDPIISTYRKEETLSFYGGKKVSQIKDFDLYLTANLITTSIQEQPVYYDPLHIFSASGAYTINDADYSTKIGIGAGVMVMKDNFYTRAALTTKGVNLMVGISHKF